MSEFSNQTDAISFLLKSDLNMLVQVLREQGYTVLAPVRADDIIALRPIDRAADIARGVIDEQSGGHYRLRESDPKMYFQYVVGPDSPRQRFMPAVQKLYQIRVNGERFETEPLYPPPPKMAFLGIRPCEVAAIGVQDRVFGYMQNETFRCEAEPYYYAARAKSLLISVDCTRPGGTCFCASMGTGPSAASGFDLALTELSQGFIVRVGTAAGKALIGQLSVRAASAEEIELAEIKIAQARDRMGRRLNIDNLPELLDQSVEDRRYDEVAQRCLSCGNCTMICPTCFCTTVSDSTDLAGNITRTRHAESCFTHQFSYTTAGPVRSTIRARYRQWMRHKLCTWWEQFGTSGCVGCGRCITWCPVGIDLTEECAAIRAHSENSRQGAAGGAT